MSLTEGSSGSKVFPAEPESEADHHSAACAQPLTYKNTVLTVPFKAAANHLAASP